MRDYSFWNDAMNLSQWFMRDAEGRIHMLGQSENLPESYNGWIVESGSASLEMHFHLERLQVEPRPFLPMPETHQMVLGESMTISGLPSGSKIFVDGDEVGLISDGILDLELGVPGIWHLRLVPPFPYLEAICEVTVT